MSYACMRRFHFILLEIKLEAGIVTVLDSRRKDPQEYEHMTDALEVSSIDHYRTTYRQLCSFPGYQVIILFVWQDLKTRK